MTATQFFRTELLLGSAALERLKNSSAAVFGLGGVGSYVVEALARSGVGRLVLIDHDVVDVTNINRQLHATTKTIGQSKTELMKQRVLDINPDIKVETIAEFYPAVGEDTDRFFIGEYDCAVDAIDSVDSKVGLIVECGRRGIPIFSSMGAGNKLDPTKFRAGDLFETTVDPLARVMRKRLKELGIKQLRVVYSTEPPRKIQSVGEKTIGSTAFVPSSAGLILAGEVVRFLVKDCLI